MKSSCQQASQLVSDAHERRLKLSERLRLRLHLLICSICRNYAHDIRLLKSVCGLIEEESADANVCMSAEEHARIRNALHTAGQPQKKGSASSKST